MLRRTIRFLGVSPFSLFMKEQRANSALEGLPIARRGRLLGRLYRGLSPKDRAALQKRAAAHPGFKHGKKKARTSKPHKSPYAKYVKKHYHDKDILKLPAPARMKALAAKWHAEHGSAAAAVKKGSAKKQIAKAAKKSKAAKPKPAKKQIKVAKKKAAPSKVKKITAKKVSSKKAKAMKKGKKAHKLPPKMAKSIKAKAKRQSKKKSAKRSNKKAKPHRKETVIAVNPKALTPSQAAMLRRLIRKASM